MIVKERDDMLSSTRYAIMMRRYAIQKPEEYKPKPKPRCSAWVA